jgi:hypothetical protein
MGVGVVDSTAATISSCLSELAGMHAAADAKIEELLTLIEGVDAQDREAAGRCLPVAEEIGRSGQVREGALIRALAQAHRVKAHRGGLAPWINTTLDVTDGRARGIDQSAREIGHLPELAAALTSGRIGAGTIRALTRTARAVKHTDRNLAETLGETLEIATRTGLTEANKHIRVLEETIKPGSAEQILTRQRERSFVRVLELEDGMCRIEALLDAERATTLRAALEATVATILRERQYDSTEPAPADVHTVEQIQAHALTRLAEVYLDATPEQRGAAFAATVLYNAPANEHDNAGLAESVYGTSLPRKILPPMGHPAAHLLEHLNGHPVTLDGKILDQNPATRLATPNQRIALGWRDKHCTHPGCTRPLTFSLHAHHQTPYSQNGPTVMGNLVLLCSRHHQLAHHPDTGR